MQSDKERWKSLFKAEYWKAIPLLNLILSLTGRAGAVVTPESRNQTIAEATEKINMLTGRGPSNNGNT